MTLIALRQRPLVLNTAWLTTAMALLACLLTFRWLAHGPSGDVGHLLFVYSFLSRVAVSLLAGAALGLGGAISQVVLRNPLAEPTTLGTSAGAQLALTLVALFWPTLPLVEKEIVAVVGALLATVISYSLAWRSGLSPLALILGGLLVSLLCSAIATIAGLLNAGQMVSVFIWSTGSLAQYDWTPAIILLLNLIIAGCGTALLLRPILTLTLNDETVRSLGVPLQPLRLAALAIAMALAGAVVSMVGVIGFVGLAAPALSRLTGARSLRAQIAWSPFLGALLLCLADQAVLAAGRWSASLPTGTATALLGAPLLFWLLPRLKEGRPVVLTERSTANLNMRPLHVTGAFIIIVLGIFVAVGYGRGIDGWVINTGSGFWSVFQWRWPRVLAATMAGSMLAVAGVILQRLTGNSLASPEVLGVSSGAAVGVILLVFAFGAIGEAERLIGAVGGATVVLAVLLTIGRHVGFSPQRMLLMGVATTTAFSAIAALLIASGDPRMQMLLGWMSGSTYQVTPDTAIAAAVTNVTLLLTTVFVARPLALAPLGRGVGQALGLSVWSGRTSLLIVASLFTAAGTLVVGPLTFVGLMGPHFARMFGFRGAMSQLFAAAAFGALVMMLADWLGRNLLYPYQVPAGLLAAIVGCPLLLWSMGKGR